MYKYPRTLNFKNKDSLIELEEHFYYFKMAELYLVGGCVRDMLLGKEPKDYDLCTNATPDDVKYIIDMANSKEGHDRYHIIETGIKHGTVTIHDCKTDMFYECTTYRIDGKYSDGRHPDDVAFTRSLEEDLKRRDFTINSFAYDFKADEILMLEESFLHDLDMGVIRCVGNAEQRFEEDALRMLRAIRFAAQLGFSIDKDTYAAISTQAYLLRQISKERIRDELTKIIMSDNPQMLELFCITGLEYWAFATNGGWVPITAMLQCTQHNKYHYTDVFHHSIDVVKRLPKVFNLRWAGLLHDIGKPLDKTTDEEGWEHFYEHAEKSVHIAEALMDILKFSTESKETIIKYIKYHDYPLSQVNNRKFKQKIVEIGQEHFVDFLKLKEADAYAHALQASTSFAIDAVSTCKDRYVKFITTKQPLTTKDLAVNGNDLIEAGVQKGPLIGAVLEQLLLKVLDDPELNTKETLLGLTPEILDGIIEIK